MFGRPTLLNGAYKMIASLLNTITQSILVISVTMMATMGITIIFKTSNTTNFAQGSVAAFGAYVATYTASRAHIPTWISIIIGIVVGIVFGLLIDVGIFRRGKNVNVIGKQIITMGLVSLIIGGIPMIFGADTPPALEPFARGNFEFDVAGSSVSIPYHSLISLLITVVVLGALFILLYKSKWGLGVRITASRETTAELVGVNTHMITATSWGISAGLAVLAAVMLTANSSISSTYMTRIQVNSFLAGILGGFSTFYGPVVGAILIPLGLALVGFLGVYAPFMQEWAEVIVYVIMFIVILIKPQGLFGKKIVKKV